MDLLEELQKRYNFEITDSTDLSLEYCLLKNEKYRIRILNYQYFQVGFIETFDRWANSVDYECKLPTNLKKLDETMTYINSLKRCNKKIGVNRKNKPIKCSSWEKPHIIKNNKGLCQECFSNKIKRKKEKN